jgi:hypothetical protein
MLNQDPITRNLAIVDQTLREVFPDDFDKRCMYTVFGLRYLLTEAGLSPQIVGGDFLCLMLSTDNRKTTLQGFGGGTVGPSHFWIEANGILIDLGACYLPRGSSYAAVPTPVIRWPLSIPLPHFLRYQAHIRYHYDVALHSDVTITQRMDEFLERCRIRSQTETRQLKLPSWELTGHASLKSAAQKGSIWARTAIVFHQRMPREQLPF